MNQDNERQKFWDWEKNWEIAFTACCVLCIIGILCWGYFTFFYQEPVNIKSYSPDDVYYELYNSELYYSVTVNNIYIEKGKENVYDVTLCPETDKEGDYDIAPDFLGEVNMQLPFSQYQSLIGENSNRVNLKCSFLKLIALCKHRNVFGVDAYEKTYTKTAFLNNSTFKEYSLNNMGGEITDFIDGIKIMEMGIVNGEFASKNTIYDGDTGIETISANSSRIDFLSGKKRGRGSSRTSAEFGELLDGYTKYQQK